MFLKPLRNFGFCFVNTRWLNSRRTVKKMIMVTIIVHSYSGFREVYLQIIRGDNVCDMNAEGMFFEFRIGGGVEVLLPEVFTNFSSSFRKKNTLKYIFVFSLPKNALKYIFVFSLPKNTLKYIFVFSLPKNILKYIFVFSLPKNIRKYIFVFSLLKNTLKYIFVFSLPKNTLKYILVFLYQRIP